MLKVFADAGLVAHRALADGVYDLTFPLPAGEADVTLGTYREAVDARERSAGVASLQHALRPASVAVIGVSRRSRSVGRSILRNILSSGFTGPVYAVNPAATELEGVRCVPSAAALPEGVDLAVIAAPAAPVIGIAEECGQRGVKALVVIAAGLGGAGRAELRNICRRHGMRMVGPASFGVADTSVGLNATYSARHPRPGCVGLALQSTGGTGFVLVDHLSRIGVGISSLVSLGDMDDVSGEDMLLWWESDPATKLALLYLESIGNPPKFARTARRVGAQHAGPDRERGPVHDGAAAGRGARRGGYPAAHPAGPVRAGRSDRHREPRRDARHRGPARLPAGTRRKPGRARVQHPRRRGARRRRVR